MQQYIDGSKAGKSELMRPAFHPGASFFGYASPELAMGTNFLFDWIDKNGPAPDIQARFVSVDILESIAVVRLEADGWSGALAGSGVRMSDVFTLLKTPQQMENHSKGISLAWRLACLRARNHGFFDILGLGPIMSKGDTKQETLESWKQIAAHLNRSERTVRRWEAFEGLPVHRREHQKQDTVFAYAPEIERWSQRRTRKLLRAAPGTLESAALLSRTYSRWRVRRPRATSRARRDHAHGRSLHCRREGR